MGLTVLFGEGDGENSQSNGNEIVVNTEGENIEGQTESPTTEPPATTVAADVVTVPFVQKHCDLDEHVKYASYRVRDYSLAKEKEMVMMSEQKDDEDACCNYILDNVHMGTYSGYRNTSHNIPLLMKRIGFQYYLIPSIHIVTN